MTRPLKCRKIGNEAAFRIFKPSGLPAEELEEVVLTLDELEAIRLADLEGLYQESAAGEMRVSRQTFGNILASARRKVGDMLINGKILTITGGNIMVTSEERVFRCATCGHEWSVEHGITRPETCPSCSGENIHRRSPGGGFGGGRIGGGRCRGFKTGLHREGYGAGIQAQGVGRQELRGRGMGRGRCTGDHDHNHEHSAPKPETGHGEGGEA
ncbi:MAG: DUF134 domain-containing protein [Chlorobium sp.]|uniref:DUF134 domain-containing protein n=1 Tax=Chlorobium sp. TaxID=1095 RepID=UPI0025C0C70E|nr:DUF134 domain-containing protein [Chlorobium sp.]MCF8216007.1 DUF134 domain-containing protein [Chlorobium sp.]MCF8270516.1 DUF134 domain-containing protein [Chlorobium sp.]MCF8287282.1 DUF134 domain-containing protein [Chlorobium sp.]MCF8290484.1 DUF134 domain-containing protein [Chlorobium sp.]MCF8384718.1 DUF134 domain-containing protein [Chlorobium sp.]